MSKQKGIGIIEIQRFTLDVNYKGSNYFILREWDMGTLCIKCFVHTSVRFEEEPFHRCYINSSIN